MKIQRLERTQFISADLQTCWDFFSDPANLAIITPDYLGFEITSPFVKPKMYPGQIITYKVKPILNIPLYWMTEITQVDDKVFFVDEQRRGPYKLWHHQHHFEEQDGGTLMKDVIHYQISELLLGSLVNVLFVRKQLDGIFDYRNEQVEKLFNTTSTTKSIQKEFAIS